MTALNTSPTDSEILVARTSSTPPPTEWDILVAGTSPTPLDHLARPGYQAGRPSSGFFRASIATIQDTAFGAIERAAANPRPRDRQEGYSYHNLPENTRRAIEEGHHPDMVALFMTARSDADLQVLMRRALEITDMRQVLEDSRGFSGFAARAFAGIINPLDIAAFGLTAGTIGFLGKGGASLWHGMARSGIATGITIGALEKVNQSISGDTGRDELDVLGMFLGAVGFGSGGGLIGQAARNASFKALKRVQFAQSQAVFDIGAADITMLRADLVSNTVNELGEQIRLTESGLRYFDPIGERAARIEHLIGILESESYDRATIEGVKSAMQAGDYEGAIRNMGKAPLRNAGIDDAATAAVSRRAEMLQKLDALDAGIQGAKEFSRTSPKATEAAVAARDSLNRLLASNGGQRAVAAGLKLPDGISSMSPAEVRSTVAAAITKIRDLQEKFPKLKTANTESKLSEVVDSVLHMDDVMERTSPGLEKHRAAVLEELSAIDRQTELVNKGPLPGIQGPKTRPGGVVPIVETPAEVVKPDIIEAGGVRKINPREGGFADFAPTDAEGKPRPPKLFNDFFAVGKSDPSGSALDPYRFGTSGTLMRSKSDVTKSFASIGTRNPLLQRSGLPLNDTATEASRRMNNLEMGLWAREHHVNFEAWYAKHAKDGEGRAEARGRFGQEHTRASRRFDTDDPKGIARTEDPDLMKMVKYTDEHSKRLERFGEANGVPGLGGGGVRDGIYLKRLFSYPKMNKLMDEVSTKGGGGQQTIESFWAGSLLSKNPDMDPALAAKMARGSIDILFDSATRTDFERAMTVEGRNTGLLRRALKGRLSDDEIEAVVRGLEGPSKAKRRAIKGSGGKRQLLDESYEMYVPELGRKITLADITVDDAYELVAINTRQIIGAGVSQEVFREMSRVSGKPIDSFGQMMSVILDAERAAGEHSLQRLNTIERQITTIHNDWMGIRQSDDTAANAFFRDLRVAAHDITSGGVGLAQMPDFAVTAGAAGWRAVIQSMPEIPSIILRTKTGQLKNELAEELQSFFGQGLEGSTALLMDRIDDSQTISQFTSRAFSQKLRRLSRWADIVSGLLPVHMTQKNTAAVLFARKMQMLAETGKGFSDKRLLQLGATRYRANAVSHMLNKHGSFTGGPGGKLRRTNIHLWENKQAAADFIVMMDKATNRWVMSPDVGQLAPWMTRDFARIFTQYKVFSLNAYETMFLSGIDMRDAQLFVETSLSMVTAALGYIGQTHLQSIGRDDRDEFLEMRLSEGAIVRAAIQRSGIFNFIPETINIGAGLLGANAPFKFGTSNTQMDVKDILGSSAVTSMLNNALRTTSTGMQAVVFGRTPTQQDVSAGLNLIPFMKQVGFLNAGNMIRSSFPKSEEE